MWNLPGPGIKPVFPALAGSVLTTGPPRKSTTITLACNLACNSTTSHHFFFVMRTFKVSSLSNFGVIYRVLLTIITRLGIRSPELIHLLIASLYTLTSLSAIPLPSVLLTTIVFYKFPQVQLFWILSLSLSHTHTHTHTHTHIYIYLTISLFIHPLRNIEVVSRSCEYSCNKRGSAIVFFFLLHCLAYRILVPWPGIKPSHGSERLPS